MHSPQMMDSKSAVPFCDLKLLNGSARAHFLQRLLVWLLNSLLISAWHSWQMPENLLSVLGL